MDDQSVPSPKLRAALKQLGNPYACDQVYEVYQAVEHAPLDPAMRAYVRRSENPYASLGVEVPAAALANPPAPMAARISRMSRADFRATAQRIFRCYIPATEKGAIRQHHKDFISRNESRSPEQRAAIIAGLRKYDLSGLGITGQFNRERDDLTAAKLASIEEQVLGKPAS